MDVDNSVVIAEGEGDITGLNSSGKKYNRDYIYIYFKKE